MARLSGEVRYSRTMDAVSRNKETPLAERLARGVMRALADLGYESLTEFRVGKGRRVDVMGLDRDGRFVAVEIKTSGRRVSFAVPEFLVYSVSRVYLTTAGSANAANLPGETPPRRKKHDTTLARQGIHEQYAQNRVQSAPFEPFDHPECSKAF